MQDSGEKTDQNSAELENGAELSEDDNCDSNLSAYSLSVDTLGKALLILVVLLFIVGRFVKTNEVTISTTTNEVKDELSTEFDYVVDSLKDPEKGKEWHLVDKVFLGN